MEMSNSNQHDVPAVPCPPPPATQPTYVPPIGYPMNDGYNQEGYNKHRINAETTSRGEGFWKGCVAGLCCCWLLDFCFGC